MTELYPIKEKVARDNRILLNNRKYGEFTGVVDAISFQPEEVLLETDLGSLSIKGQGLHVRKLNLEKGEVEVEGMLQSISYGKNIKKRSGGEGIWAKLFG